MLDGPFAGKDGKPARDLSGIACRPAGDGHTCLVVNDESPLAQLAGLHRRRLVPGRTIDLIANIGSPLAGATPPAGTFGSEAAARPVSSERCPDRNLDKDFDEFDGEGIAYAPAGSGGFFYVVGSHACGRSNASRRRSTHLLARIPVDDAGTPSGPAELTWRLGEALLRAEPIRDHYGLPLDRTRQGLDIEGIAARSDGELILGLRAPQLGNDAVVLRVRASELFDATPGSRPSVRVARIPLGGGTGIRDLAALPDGRLLVLTGAPQDQVGIPQQILAVTPDDQPVWAVQRVLARITLPRPEAKAEGIAVLGTSSDAMSVLVLFEDVERDNPVELSIPMH